MKKKILLTGCEAMAQAACYAGCKFYAGYPITPQNELTAYMAEHMVSQGRVFIQAESEIAAISMVMGASASGARAMTSSSSPGISLKQEGISYMAGAQLPAVIVNATRGGPGLGNIASAQGDYFQATRGGGHGDYFTPVLAPKTVQEAARMVVLAFDLADYYRTPVLVLVDAIVAQTMEPIESSFTSEFDKPLPIKNWALTGALKRPANVVKSFFLNEGDLEKHNLVLQKKWETIQKNEQRYSTYKTDDAKILIVAYGSQARIAQEAVDILRQQGIKAGLFCPVTLWPFPEKGLRFATKKIKKVFVVEQSLGQMVQDVRLSLPDKSILFFGRAGGGVPSEDEIVKFVNKNR